MNLNTDGCFFLGRYYDKKHWSADASVPVVAQYIIDLSGQVDKQDTIGSERERELECELDE